jgi:hypothetical protein
MSYRSWEPNAIGSIVPPFGGSGGGPPPPPAGPDRFAPKYLVGNVPAGDSNVVYSSGGFFYLPDPGDGSGIAAALAAAVLVAGDVWIRPGIYNLGSGSVVTPLVVPTYCLVRGAGEATQILGKASVDQGVFRLFGAGSGLRDLRIEAPPAAEPTAGSIAVVSVVNARCSVQGCVVAVSADAASALLYGIDAQGSAANITNNRIISNGTNASGVPLRLSGGAAAASGNAIAASAADVAAIFIASSENACTSNVCNLGAAPTTAAIVLAAGADNNIVLGNVCRTTPSVDDTAGGVGNEVAHNI